MNEVVVADGGVTTGGYAIVIWASLLAGGAVLWRQWCDDPVPATLVAQRKREAAQQEEPPHQLGRHSPPAVALSRFQPAREFDRTARQYLLGFGIMSLADWLQGPYLFAMYASFQMTLGDMNVLYATDYATGMLLCVAAGLATDRYGAKNACIVYGVVYAAANLFNHGHAVSFVYVAVGCALDGLCNALLRSSFETWFTERCGQQSARRRTTPETWMAYAFAKGSWMSTSFSVGAGFLGWALVKAYQSSFPSAETGTMAVDRNGRGGHYMATMDAAAVLLLLGAAYIAVAWAPSSTSPAGGGRRRVRGPPLAATRTVSRRCEGTELAAASVKTTMRRVMRLLWLGPEDTEGMRARNSGGRQQRARGAFFAEICIEATLFNFIANYCASLVLVHNATTTTASAAAGIANGEPTNGGGAVDAAMIPEGDDGVPFGFLFSALMSWIVVGSYVVAVVNARDDEERRRQEPKYERDLGGVGRSTLPSRMLLLSSLVLGVASVMAAALSSTRMLPSWLSSEPGKWLGSPTLVRLLHFGALCACEFAFGVYYPSLAALHSQIFAHVDDGAAEVAAAAAGSSHDWLSDGSQRGLISSVVRGTSYALALVGLAVNTWFGAPAAWLLSALQSLGAAAAIYSTTVA